MPDVWREGLDAAGYRVKTTISKPPARGDVLLVWNRYGNFDCQAQQFERAGATVLVAENGYYGRDENDRRLYAVSLSQHHHGGALPDASRMTWPLSPPKRGGKVILVCEQRGIGSPLMRSPPEWAEKTAQKLRMLGHKTRIRRHPGKEEPAIPLVDDLADARLCAVWSSACGVEALVNGVEVVYDAPRWIAQRSATYMTDFLASGQLNPASSAGLINAASNQWRIDEIKSGLPFLRLGCDGKKTD